MPDVEVRPVSLAETRLLRRNVLRPRESLERLADGEPTGAFAVGVSDGEALVAVGFVAPDGGPGAWRVRGMATTPGVRGLGLGGAVLAALVRYALRQGASRVWCNARTPARSLYERAGFNVVSAEFERPDTGPHLVMEFNSDNAGPGALPFGSSAAHRPRPATSASPTH